MSQHHLGAQSSDDGVPVSEAAFSRQRNLVDFDDALLAKQRCLVVGSGGVGSCIGLTLARIGVEHITFVDMDTVAASNLNRQLLFSQDQIGQRKALACKESVDKLHSVRTTTDALDLDAVANWGRIVDAAVTGRMTAVFNGCDYGCFFDTALQSLARAVDPPVPYAAASTYAYTYQNDVYGPSGTCLQCTNPPMHPVSWRDFEAGGPASRPVGQAEALGVLRSLYKSEHEFLPGMVRRAIGRAAEAHGAAGAAPGAEPSFPRTEAAAGTFRAALTDEVCQQLRPSRVREHASLTFIPADPKPTTASVGSWAVVCGMGSMFAVNCWLQGLMGMEPPTMSICYINASKGQSWREQFGWENFKAHAESTDGCWLCGFTQPGPTKEEAAAGAAEEAAKAEEAEARARTRAVRLVGLASAVAAVALAVLR